MAFVDSSAVSEHVTHSITSYVDPEETVAVHEYNNFNISLTRTLSNYNTAKAAEVAAFNTLTAAKSTAATDKALYLTTLSTYQVDNSDTNRAAAASAFSTWQSALSTVATDKTAWLLASENTFLALQAMGSGE